MKQFLKTAYYSSHKAILPKVNATTSTEALLESVAYLHGEAALWWIDNLTESEDGRLCTVCRHINFDALLTDALEDNIPLGSLQAIAIKTECSFCRLVAHTGLYTLETTVDRLKDKVYCELCDDIAWNRYVTRIRYLCLKLTIFIPDCDQTLIKYGRMQQILSSGGRPPEQSQNDSRIVKNQVNLELIKSWIETCKESHNSTYLESSFSFSHESFIPDKPTDIHDQAPLIHDSCQSIPAVTATYSLTLVDVKMERLVDMPLNTTYIALSYVWGGVQLFQNVMKRQKDLYISKSISVDNEAIPLTIRDAIRLIRDLGERYLWVDSLCICQDNIENKENQIMNMGNIYSQALITITAASGSDANAGLPGVRTRSRKSAQRAECVQGLVLVNELCQLEDIIEPSYWNTRCWTYQEAKLSKRCIVFCETHIFFQCNRVTYKEDSGIRNVAIRGDRASKIRAERQPVWRSYQKAVSEYTRRFLSDDSDAVNAFQGIADLLQAAFKGDFLCGLPETELDIALLWQPASLIRRRVHLETQRPLFPSWSWTGWIGEVKYSWTKHQLDDISRVEWQCMDRENESIRFCTSDELRGLNRVDHDRWHYVSNARGPPYYYQAEKPEIWCLHPVAPKEQRRYYRLIQPGSQLLVFRAYTAVLRISSTSCTSLGEPLGDESGFTQSLAIFGSDGFIAGKVFVPLQAIGKLKRSDQEFVCLSRRRRNQFDHGPAPEDDFKDIPDQVTLYPYSHTEEELEAEFDSRRYNMHMPWPLYNVMMIERDEDGDLAKRIALGLMHVTAFVQAAPVKKVIRLA